GILIAEEEIEGNASAAAGGPASRISIGLRDTGNVHAGQGLGIFGEGSIGDDNENVAQLVGVAGADFFDAYIVGSRGLVGAHHEFNFRGNVGVDRRQGHGIQAASSG